MRLYVILLSALCLMGLSRCQDGRVKPDVSISAIEANDATVLIDGCGNQPAVGYTYCRVREGDPTTGTISVVVPPSVCLSKTSCASLQVFFPTGGNLTLGVTVPAGQERVAIAWSDLVKRTNFLKDDRGFWPVLLTWKWLDPNGVEQTTTAEGEIRMRVLGAGYLSLSAVTDSPDFAWRWSDARGHYGVATSGRATAQP